jgi:hypothetical protein
MIGALLAAEWRFLTFRAPGAALREHPRAMLAFGLLATWAAGMGRYWDNPRAQAWQVLGLGSLAYVLLLALLVWALIAPLRPKHWSYRNVLLFVALTAPPAWLYAIPVERFLTLEAAASANVWFLATVATWRVALYAVFLRRSAGLSREATLVGTLLPLVAIVVALTWLNLEHVVFNLMGGLNQRTANDDAYLVVWILSSFSILAAPVLLAIYGRLAYFAWRDRKRSLLEEQK